MVAENLWLREVSQDVAKAAAVGAVLATPEAAHARLPEEPGCLRLRGSGDQWRFKRKITWQMKQKRTLHIGRGLGRGCWFKSCISRWNRWTSQTLRDLPCILKYIVYHISSRSKRSKCRGPSLLVGRVIGKVEETLIIQQRWGNRQCASVLRQGVGLRV